MRKRGADTAHRPRPAAPLPAFSAGSTAACDITLMFRSVTIAALAATIALASAAPSPASGKADRCYADWSEAATVVRREALALSSEVQLKSRALAIGEVVRMTLCEERGRYTYRLVVRRADGVIDTLTVDARRPF